MTNQKCLGFNLYLLLLLVVASVSTAQSSNKDKGRDAQSTMDTSTHTPMAEEPNGRGFNFEEVARTCNASFTIPLEYIQQFNATSELPNTSDKTGMCFLRCYLENTGLIRNWQLNRALIEQTMWPATGDSISVCQSEGSDESCPCKRAYAIAKCLMIRSLVDARNKPSV